MIAGHHRFEAARNCGHQTIRAEVYDSLSDDEAELIQIDENLIRANLSDAERILHVARRKELYEKLHPETKHGGDRRSAGARSSSQNENLKAFVADIAVKTGKNLGLMGQPGDYRQTPEGALEPADLRARALANQWMDWQLSVAGPAITDAFIGLIRTPPEKRNHAAIEESKTKTTTAMIILDAQLAKTRCVAGDGFSYGDIPVAIMVYRYRQLVPERPPLPEMERWYAEVSARQAFKDHVGAVPLT